VRAQHRLRMRATFESERARGPEVPKLRQEEGGASWAKNQQPRAQIR
jgi:hypothetical protein